MPPHLPRMRRASGSGTRVHIRVDGLWHRGGLWDILNDLPCAECGRQLHPGDLVVRGLGLPPQRQQDLLCTATCRPFHVSRPPEAPNDLGDLLNRGVPTGVDPECYLCREEAREDERARRRAAAEAPSEADSAPSTISPGDGGASPTWLLLVCAYPADAAQQRTAGWRDLKKSGAIALRDGVFVLPENDATAATFQSVVAQVEASGGWATLIRSGRLDQPGVIRVEARLREERGVEYAAAATMAEHLLEQMRDQRESGDSSFERLEEREAEVETLRRRVEQIRSRDHFGVAASTAIDDLLRRAEDALAALEESAACQDEAAILPGSGRRTGDASVPGTR